MIYLIIIGYLAGFYFVAYKVAKITPIMFPHDKEDWFGFIILLIFWWGLFIYVFFRFMYEFLFGNWNKIVKL